MIEGVFDWTLEVYIFTFMVNISTKILQKRFMHVPRQYSQQYVLPLLCQLNQILCYSGMPCRIKLLYTLSLQPYSKHLKHHSLTVIIVLLYRIKSFFFIPNADPTRFEFALKSLHSLKTDWRSLIRIKIFLIIDRITEVVFIWGLHGPVWGPSDS